MSEKQDRQTAAFYALQLKNFAARMAELITYDEMVDQAIARRDDKPYAPVFKEIDDAWRDFVALVEYLGVEPPWRPMMEEEKKAIKAAFSTLVDSLNQSITELERRIAHDHDRRESQDKVILEQLQKLDDMIELLIGQDLTHKERDGQVKLLREYVKRDMQFNLLHPDGLPF